MYGGSKRMGNMLMLALLVGMHPCSVWGVKNSDGARNGIKNSQVNTNSMENLYLKANFILTAFDFLKEATDKEAKDEGPIYGLILRIKNICRAEFLIKLTSDNFKSKKLKKTLLNFMDAIQTALEESIKKILDNIAQDRDVVSALERLDLKSPKEIDADFFQNLYQKYKGIEKNDNNDKGDIFYIFDTICNKIIPKEKINIESFNSSYEELKDWSSQQGSIFLENNAFHKNQLKKTCRKIKEGEGIGLRKKRIL